MNRRQLIKGSVAIVGTGVLVGYGPPACNVSKDKAVRYAGFVINYLKDLRPLVVQIGGSQIAELIDRAIPVLEKLKNALENSEIPTAQSFFQTVTGILGQVANALFQLPESPTRDTVMGILTIVNVTLRTVSLFVESEAPPLAAADSSGPRRSPSGYRPSETAIQMRKAFEATRF